MRNNWKRNLSDSRNHQRFTLRYISLVLIPFSLKLKSTIRINRVQEFIHKTEIKLLKQCLRTINNATELIALEKDMCETNLVSVSVNNHNLQKESSNFINKIWE